MDYTTPRAAAHSIKERFINSRFGKPIQRKRDAAALSKLTTSRLNHEMPEGIKAVIDGITDFNKIKF